MTHIINEGDSKRGKNPQAAYNNLDPNLHNIVAALVEALGGHWSRRIGKDNAPVTQIDTTTVRALVKAGLVPGRKASGQYFHHLPDLMLEDHALSKYHLSATFTEEGWPSLVLEKDKRPRFLIGYSRSIDVTENLPEDFRQSLEVGEKLSVGDIPNHVRAELYLIPFALLDDEIKMIEENLHDSPNVNLVSLYKSKDEKITAEWRVSFYGPTMVEKFREEIGFLPGIEVATRFEELWGVYTEIKDKKLSQEDIEKLRKKLSGDAH